MNIHDHGRLHLLPLEDSKNVSYDISKEEETTKNHENI
jgi:hypothetical protein